MLQSNFKRRVLMVMAAPLLFTGCASAQTQAETAPAAVAVETPPAADTTNETAPAVRQAKPALWVVKDADTTIYLFGTIHLLPKDVVWFQQPVQDALAGSDALVLEIIEPSMGEAMRMMNKYGNAADGIALRDRLDPETRANYEAQMQANGLPVAAFDNRQPWLAQITLYGVILMKGGWDPASGAESVLTKAARAANKPILELETADEQFAILSGASIADQVQMLAETVNKPDELVSLMDNMMTQWLAGDADALGLVMEESMGEGSAFEAELLTKRNANWTVWLDKRMDEPGTIFVAVGAAHLAGRNSVQTMLAKEGHTAERVVY